MTKPNSRTIRFAAGLALATAAAFSLAGCNIDVQPTGTDDTVQQDRRDDADDRNDDGRTDDVNRDDNADDTGNGGSSQTILMTAMMIETT